ncbi:MAG: ATP-binding protein [Bacteroidota bacterium]
MEKKDKHVKRIALLGPECTAKSTLSEALAKHFNTVWVPEYARSYLAPLTRKYTPGDIIEISKVQIEQERIAIEKANKYIFVDTELIISKVWCLDVFNTCPEWITSTLLKTKFDLYLLTYPDLPWEEDVLRENPLRREYLFDWYEKELIEISANYAIIKGRGYARLENCIKAINQLL